jgi:putative acetyltransferase
MNNIVLRKIAASDDAILASIVRRSLEEFNTVKEGTVYFDATTDHLHLIFETARSAYFVAQVNGVVCGGAGIFPTVGLPANCCELVKMYLSPAARGMGIGKLLLNTNIREAKSNDYDSMYLESMPELQTAIAMYEKNGFRFLKDSLGNSGHTGCQVFMIKDL